MTIPSEVSCVETVWWEELLLLELEVDQQRTPLEHAA